MFLKIAAEFGSESGSDSVVETGVGREATVPPPVADAGYKIIKEIGSGGAGTVWSAQQLGTGQMVALKTLQRHLIQKPGVTAQFHTEVRLAASLKHPNIARVFDSGLDRLDYFYVMELIDGQPINEHVAAEGRTPREIVGLMIDICGAVSYAHAQGVMHLDLKPTNILVTEEGHPYILDFGLARIVGQLDPHPTYRAGTRGYAAPEQMIFGESLDQRADIFAIGCILQRLLESSSFKRPIPRADDFQAIIRRAVAEDRNHRYQTMQALASDLQRWIKLQPVTVQPRTVRYTSELWVQRNRKPLGLGVLLASVLLLAAIGIGLAVMQREAATQQINLQSKDTLYKSTLRSVRERLYHGDVQAAQRLLQGYEASNAWEWRHLSSLADQSTHTIIFKDGAIRDFAPMSAGQIVCMTLSGNVRYLTAEGGVWTETGLADGVLLPMAISPEGDYALGLNREGQSVIHTLDLAEQLAPMILADSPATYNKVSPSGRYILIGTNSGEFLLYDTNTSALIHREPRATGNLVACFSDDDRSLVWYDKAYKVLDLETLSSNVINAGVLGRGSPRSMAAIGGTLFTAMGDGAVLKCAIDGMAEVSEIARLSDEIATIAASPDGNTIACGDSDGAIHLIEDTEAVTVLRGHTSPITKLVFSGDGHQLYSLASSGDLKVWDSHWDVITHQPWPSGNALFYATDADGRFVAYSSPESITRLLDTRTDSTDPESGDGRMAELWKPPSSLALSPDATRMGIAGIDRTIEVHNITARAQPKALMMSAEPAYWLSFEYSRSRLVASNSQEVLIWDHEKGEHSRVPKACGPAIWLKSLPGQLVMIRRSPLGYDVEVRNADKGLPVIREYLGTDPVIAMSAAADVVRVATLDSTGLVKVLDIGDRRMVAAIPANNVGAVLAIALTPDGSRVVTAGDSVAIWSIDSGELLDVIEERTTGPIMSIRFTDDGRDLIGLGLAGRYKWRAR